MQSNNELPLWKRQPSPLVSALTILAVLLIIVYMAYLNSFLPIHPKSEFEARLGQLAGESQGNFKKLSDSDQKYLNDHTGGRGAMAIRAYLDNGKTH